MAPATAYFELLEDGLVQDIIRRIDKSPVSFYNNGWSALSASSRRLCTLVGANSWSCAPLDVVRAAWW
jgi:hypothetical protein